MTPIPLPAGSLCRSKFGVQKTEAAESDSPGAFVLATGPALPEDPVSSSVEETGSGAARPGELCELGDV